MKKPPILDHLMRIKEKTKVLEVLQDVLIMHQMLMHNQQTDFQGKNPLEALYHSLCAKVTKLDPHGDIFQIINKAVVNTQVRGQINNMGVVVRDIYEIDKPSETLRFKPFESKLHNKCLLWHGFRNQQVASVLREGIRLPHPKSSQAGFMFGKGIYFSDCFSKAMLQCGLSNGSSDDHDGSPQVAYVLLAEVALGDMHKQFSPHQFKRSAPNYCHSVYGVGQQKPAPSGVKDLMQNGPDFSPDIATFSTP